MKDKRNRKEFPYPEHLSNYSKPPLCGSTETNPIVLKNTAANPPEAICPKCRKELARLVKTDWDEFLTVIGTN